jgi:hypothetical protein
LDGGEGGIRTLDTRLTYTPLAGERLQPLGHFSGGCESYHSEFAEKHCFSRYRGYFRRFHRLLRGYRLESG